MHHLRSAFLCGPFLLTLAAAAPAQAPLGIFHDTSVLPPRAREAMVFDPLGVFAGSVFGSESRMNVGLLVKLSLVVPGGSTVSNIQWTIPGSIIDGFTIVSETATGQGYLSANSYSLVQPSELQQVEVSYYYKNTGVSTVTLQATVDGTPMSAVKTFDVRRNPKAEIFYVNGDGTSFSPGSGEPDIDGDGDADLDDFELYQTSDHWTDPSGEGKFGRIGEHRFWHTLVPETFQDEFFRFHRGFIWKFEAWRAIFGYPCVQVYATFPSVVPTTPEVDHSGVAGDGNGIIDLQRDTDHQVSIVEMPAKFTINGDGTTKLVDYASGNAIVNGGLIGYHDSHHGFICHSGDFTFTGTTPADPIFWRFHYFLTEVWELWMFLKLEGTTMTVSASHVSGAEVYFPNSQYAVSTGCANHLSVAQCNPPSGTLFPIGTTTVTCTVEDVNRLDPNFPGVPGTTKTFTFNVNVVPDSPSEVWVDFAYSGPESGTFAEPYDTLSEGLAGVLGGGTIRIKTGSSPETLTIIKPVELTSSGGSATIGS